MLTFDLFDLGNLGFVVIVKCLIRMIKSLVMDIIETIIREAASVRRLAYLLSNDWSKVNSVLL
ncbi:hypothetical protein AWW68_06440 [Roseivirga spongicola]|uniref:Uncharacterized protein n=1 Tax=Roseivirga spongicola TaxID=333140 RepID=A0A150XI51_9BACT|nr:hypothetical protein AWW68_06440 [Roseivirga spongicola]